MSRTEYSARRRRESLSKRLGSLARRIRLRDHDQCVYCGATEASSGSHLHLDHLTPRSCGGEDSPQNLVLACRSCNSRRHDLALSVWCRGLGLDLARVRRQARRALPALVRS